MSERLAGKRALVTGAASGIGRATAKLFALEGARVVLCDISQEPGERAAREIGQGRARFLEVNVAEERSVQAMVTRAVEWLGGLDILINNAGVGGVGPPKPLAELSLETWDTTIDTNLKGTFLVSKFCLPHLLASGGGAIVNLVSTYSLVGGPGLAAYCASKGGILALTRNMAIDYAAHKIRANALAPGFVDTPMLRTDVNKDPDPHGVVADIVSRIPQGELMTAEQVARVILFLASEDSQVMTGSLVVADGGYTAR
jgi:NAD(P)-dependent dehydrogenase (short-subunit alcohol dehydrogenase family)